MAHQLAGPDITGQAPVGGPLFKQDLLKLSFLLGGKSFGLLAFFRLTQRLEAAQTIDSDIVTERIGVNNQLLGQSLHRLTLCVGTNGPQFAPNIFLGMAVHLLLPVDQIQPTLLKSWS